MSAIEVLKKERGLYLTKILEIEKASQSRPDDIVKMYKRSIKVYKEFIDALDEALLALEKLDRLEKHALKKHVIIAD